MKTIKLTIPRFDKDHAYAWDDGSKMLFRHLFPEAYSVHKSEMDLLFTLAEAHGWTVEIIEE